MKLWLLGCDRERRQRADGQEQASQLAWRNAGARRKRAGHTEEAALRREKTRAGATRAQDERRKANQIEIDAPDENVQFRRRGRLQTRCRKTRVDEPIDRIENPNCRG